jgi:signal transduction histidine kinase
MITLIPEPNVLAERVKNQPGKIKPGSLLPQGQVQSHTSDDLAELLSHQILSSAAKVETIAYILGELSVSSTEFPPEVLSTLHSVTRQLRYLGHNALYLGSTARSAAQLSFKPVSITGLMDEVVETFQVQAPDRDLVKVYPSNLLDVRGDADQLRVVLDNLINNALKYSPPQSPIILTAERCRGLTEKDNGHLLVSVSNFGSYIPPEEQDKIFTKFYRGEAYQQPGQGLGLPLSRRLIELHGGQLEVESSIADGTIFWFTVPLVNI